MKDEHDKSMADFCPVEPDGLGTSKHPLHIPQGREADAQEAKKPRPKRLTNQPSQRPPPGAKPELEGCPPGFGRSVLPVSAAAKDWGVSTRRIRFMLSTGRLNGRRHENGYWEVYYPYRYTFGTRGPIVKRQQRQPDKPKKPGFAEHSPEW